MSLLPSQPIILPRSHGKKENKRELNAELKNLEKMRKGGIPESLVRTVRKGLTAGTDKKVLREEAKGDVEEITGSDILTLVYE